MVTSIDEIEQKHYTVMPIDRLYPELQRLYSTTSKGSSDRARVSVLLGTYFETRENATAAKLYEEAFRIGNRVNDRKILSDSILGQAKIAFLSGRLSDSLRLATNSERISFACGHAHCEASSKSLLRTISLSFGSMETGIDYLNRAIRLAELNGYLKLRAIIESDISVLLLMSGELDKAREHALSARNISESIGLESELLKVKLRLGSIALEQHDLTQVIDLIEQVRGVLPPENHSLWCVTHTLMGKVHEAKRRYDKAETEFRAALALADYVNAERVRSNVHTHLAELYLKTKKPEAALIEALAALSDAETAQDSYVRKEALRCVHDCYKALGQYKEAHEYLERYNALVVESDTALLKNRLEYHALKSEYEKEKVKSEEKTKQSDLLRIKLDYKERELTEKIRHLLRQAEAVRQFRDDLRSLVRRSPSDDPYVKDIRARLSSFTEEELNWQEFEKEFREVHPDFLRTLTAKYPDLTQMEQRIAAMLRMELKSFDIARLFCVTERAVEFHRLNLRKKLGLKRGQDLAKVLRDLK